MRRLKGRKAPEQTFWPWRLFKNLVLPWLVLLSKRSYRHLDRIPATGPSILVANHHSALDPLFMALTVWDACRVPRFLAKASIWKSRAVGYVMTATGQIPVDRGMSATSAVHAAAQLVENGSTLVVYPEGTLTRDPGLWPMRGKTGAARIALESGVPVYPVAHWGIHRILPPYGKPNLFPRKKVEIIVGEALDLSRWQGLPVDGKVLAEVTEYFMDAITALLAELREETPPAERWDPSRHGQAETGRL